MIRNLWGFFEIVELFVPRLSQCNLFLISNQNGVTDCLNLARGKASDVIMTSFWCKFDSMDSAVFASRPRIPNIPFTIMFFKNKLYCNNHPTNNSMIVQYKHSCHMQLAAPERHCSLTTTSLLP